MFFHVLTYNLNILLDRASFQVFAPPPPRFNFEALIDSQEPATRPSGSVLGFLRLGKPPPPLNLLSDFFYPPAPPLLML